MRTNEKGIGSGPAHTLALALCTVAAVWILFAILATGAGAADGNFGGGTGTENDPYLIEDVLDLQAMKDGLNKHYALANDIDASATKDWNDGAGFEPIGDNDNHFTGLLDGGDYIITGLYIYRPSTNHVGLFGVTGSGTSVSNVGMENVDITGKKWVGGFVGYNYEGSVEKCYVTGSVRGEYLVGGFCGTNWGGTVSKSYTTGRVSGTQDVGGLVGNNYEGSVEDCHATGSVSGSTSVGGLVGNFFFGSVSNCYATGNVSGRQDVGGLVGTNWGSVSNCYATGSVSGDGQSIGGLVGYNYQGSVENCSTTGRVMSGSAMYVGGLVGRNSGSVSNCSATGRVSGNDMVGGLVGSNGWNSISNSYATGSVSGTEHVGGLVGYNDRGSVDKCYATGGVSGREDVGGLLGCNYLDSSVSNCYATGSITRASGSSDGSFGGFVGNNNRGRILNCYSTGSVHYSGGSDPTNKGFCGGVDTSGNYEMTGNFWDKETSRQTSTAGNAIGKTTAEMMSVLTFTDAGWDFDEVWGLIVNLTYPLHKWQNVIIAHAGADQAVDEGAEVIFDGSASASLDDGGIVNYTWTFNDGTGEITLYGVAPGHTFIDPGTYTVTLTVTDAASLTDTDTMTVTVNDITQPSAHAGTDLTVDEGTNVIFNGNASTDNVGIINHTWTFNDGTEDITLYGVAPGYIFTVSGVYVVTLTVTDAAGNSNTDTMTVTVKDITPPTANAGPDRTVDEGTNVIFNGSASTDNVGIINHTWTFNDGTGNITLYGVIPGYLFTVPGVYLVTLTVTDAAGNSNTDTMTVTVRDITPPTAHAGPDQIVDQGAQVTFNGTASTDNVGVVNYTWTFHDGIKDRTLFGPSPRHTFTIPGNYTVTLTITDLAGLQDTDTMTVTVTGTNGGSPTSIPRPRWDTGDQWTWLFTTMIEGQAFTYFFSEEIVGANITSTDNGTILPEPCFKIEATFINEGKSTVVGYAWLSMETLQTHEQIVIDNSFLDEEDEDEDHSSVTILDYFLFGFMSVKQWPIEITTEGPYRWSDAGMVDVGERSFLCYRFNGTEGFSIYYSPEARHFVKALWEIDPPSDYTMYELMPDGAGPDGGKKGRGDDDSPLDPLFENLGPLPLIGYVGILVLTMLIAVAGTRRRKGRTEMNGTVTDPGVFMPESLPPPQVFQGSFSGTAEPAPMHPSASPGFPPWQTPQPAGPAPTQPPASSGFPPWQTSQSAGSSPIQPPASSAPSLLSTPPPSPDLHTPPSGFPSPPAPAPSPGVWFCPKCGKKLDTKYIFCLDCGFRRDG